MPYPVKHLIQGQGALVTAQKDDSAAQALGVMIEHDYSQLPVVDGDQRLVGMVTHESILRGVKNFRAKLEELQVRDVMVDAPKTNLEDDLFDLLDRLKLTNAVLVVDPEERVRGIVTSYDSTEYFRSRTEDLMRVEDIEVTLKDFIQLAYTDPASGAVDEARLREAIAKTCRPAAGGQEKEKAFEELTLWEYINLILYGETWKALDPIFRISKGTLNNLLNEVRKTRNELAHFRGEISAEQQDQLKFCAHWLARRQEECQEAARAKAGEPERENGHEAGAGEGVDSEEMIVEPSGPKDSRYAPLADHLMGQPSRVATIELEFNEIEKIIGGELPVSARQHRSWWANDAVGHVQSKQWLEAGWRTSYINTSEQRVTFTRIREREKAYIQFYSGLLKALKAKGEAVGMPVKDGNPGGVSWIIVSTLPRQGAAQVYLMYSFSRDQQFRVELYIDTSDQERNKKIFDLLHAQKAEFEAELGTMSWERLDEKRASRIAFYHNGTITDSKKDLKDLRDWAAERMVAFYQVFYKPTEKAIEATK